MPAQPASPPSDAHTPPQREGTGEGAVKAADCLPPLNFMLGSMKRGFVNGRGRRGCAAWASQAASGRPSALQARDLGRGRGRGRGAAKQSYGDGDGYEQPLITTMTQPEPARPRCLRPAALCTLAETRAVDVRGRGHSAARHLLLDQPLGARSLAWNLPNHHDSVCELPMFYPNPTAQAMSAHAHALASGPASHPLPSTCPQLRPPSLTDHHRRPNASLFVLSPPAPALLFPGSTTCSIGPPHSCLCSYQNCSCSSSLLPTSHLTSPAML